MKDQTVTAITGSFLYLRKKISNETNKLYTNKQPTKNPVPAQDHWG